MRLAPIAHVGLLGLLLLAGPAHALKLNLDGRPESYITVGADAVPELQALADRNELFLFRVIESDIDSALVAVRPRDIDRIANEMHDKHGRCGGFIAYDTLLDAEAAFTAQREGRPVEYTIDRPDDVGAALAKIDQGSILSTIRELQDMGSRYYKSKTGAAASTWLAARWQSFTTRPDVKIELVDHGYPQKSVMMTVPGTTRANEVVVIGGHLDSISLSGFSSDAPGADDDASGIATLTEVARVLLTSDYRPERTIVFIAYAAEEVGLRGSQAIAKSFAIRGVDVVGALQLDMTNYQGSDKDIWFMKDFTSAEQNQFLIQLVERYVHASWGLDACGYACSDHASWHQIGVRASMPFEARMKDGNKFIHTSKDTLEASANNARHAAKFARLAAAYAIELAKGHLPRAPKPERDGSWQLAVLALLGVAGLRLSRVKG